MLLISLKGAVLVSVNDVSLDEMTKKVVKWMDGWELVYKQLEPKGPKELVWVSFNASINIGPIQDCTEVRPHYIYESLDVIQKVEKQLDEKGLMLYYASNLAELLDFDKRNATLMKRFDLATADTITRLRAIYRTLKEEGELEQYK